MRADRLDPDKHLQEMLALHNGTDAPRVDGGTLTEALFRATHLTPARSGEILAFGARDARDRLVGLAIVEAHPERGHGFRLVVGEHAQGWGAAVDAALEAARKAESPSLRGWARTADSRILLQSYGLRITRIVTEMTRSLGDDVPEPTPGLEVRTPPGMTLGEAVDLLNAAYAAKWPTFEAWTPDDLARWATAPGARIFGGHEDGRLVGVCGVRPRAALPATWEIGRFAVHPDAQGRGVGRRLLRTALHTLTNEENAGLAHLSVFPGNPEALHLYGSEGFRVTGHSWVLAADPQW